MSESDELDAIRERKRQEFAARAGGGADGPGEPASVPAEPVAMDSAADLEAFTDAHEVVLVDFHADWCGPCQLVEPTVREIAQNTPAAVAKVDIDALPGLARELDIRGVPTLFLYVNGEPAERLVGVQDYGTLESLVSQHASSRR